MTFAVRDQKNLWVRIITAIFGVAAILACIGYGGKTGVGILAMMGAWGALAEYFTMIFPLEHKKHQKRMGIWAGLIISIPIILNSFYLYETITLSLMLLFLFYLILDMMKDSHEECLDDLARSIFGIFYISILFSCWPKVCDLSHGKEWIFLVFIIPWFSDTAAYFGGKIFGKHKLAEAISPKKTMEGAYAGVGASVLGVALYKQFFFPELTWIDVILLGTAGSVISQIVDLFESFVKRAASVKDSGVIIPGHGGILDRFDGVLFCSPFIYFYARFW